jgi:hypothetical protein
MMICQHPEKISPPQLGAPGVWGYLFSLDVNCDEIKPLNRHL